MAITFRMTRALPGMDTLDRSARERAVSDFIVGEFDDALIRKTGWVCPLGRVPIQLGKETDPAPTAGEFFVALGWEGAELAPNYTEQQRAYQSFYARYDDGSMTNEELRTAFGLTEEGQR